MFVLILVILVADKFLRSQESTLFGTFQLPSNEFGFKLDKFSQYQQSLRTDPVRCMQVVLSTKVNLLEEPQLNDQLLRVKGGDSLDTEEMVDEAENRHNSKHSDHENEAREGLSLDSTEKNTENNLKLNRKTEEKSEENCNTTR